MNTETALASLRGEAFTDARVDAVLARSTRDRRHSTRAVLAVAAALAVLVAAAVPPSRAELADTLRAALHGGDVPGRTLPASEIPDWLRQVQAAGGTRPHVLAEAGGTKLLVFRQASGALCFDVGGVGICDATETNLFGEHPLALLGPTKGRSSGEFELWGLTLASVASVEVRFAEAAPVRVETDGAFGLTLNESSPPTTIMALDEAGTVLAELDLSERWQRRPAL